MNRKLPIIAIAAALSIPAFAFAQEAIPKPETNEQPMSQAGEAVTDTWITTKVKSDLLATKDVSGSEIKVDTKDGVVTLTGNVETQAEADKAKSVAAGIKGVTSVDSQITVCAETP